MLLRSDITSLATIKYRHEEDLLAEAVDLEATCFQIMQGKLALELEYIDHQFFWLDLNIIFWTILAVLR